MKYLLALLLTASMCAAGTPFKVTATDTLPAVVVAYADGQNVRGSQPNKIVFKVRLKKTKGMPLTGWITKMKLRMDTCEAGLFMAYVLGDTVGIGKDFSADHAAFQTKPAVDSSVIIAPLMNVVAEGSAAGGSTEAMAITQVLDRFIVDVKRYKDLDYAELFFILEAKGAYTPKSRGVARITLSGETD